MKNERLDKKAIIKEAKENEELYKFVKSLTQEEIDRIKEIREHNMAIPGTITYKVSVLQDTLRNQIRIIKSTIAKRLWTIDDLQNNIDRLQIQLIADEFITETMKNGMLMNTSEVNSLTQHSKWLKDGEFNALFSLLGQLRTQVMHKDVSGKIIMTIEEYDKYVLDVEEYLRNYNYELFGELNETINKTKD